MLHKASIDHETALTAALEDLRTDLAEQHQNEVTQALNELRNAHSLELHASLSETKSEQNERFSATTRDMIERLGKEHREAMETHRVQQEGMRASELEKHRAEVKKLLVDHRATVGDPPGRP